MKYLIYLYGCETVYHRNFISQLLVSYSSCYFSSLDGDSVEVSKYQRRETSLSCFSSYITFQASLEQFSGIHRDLRRQIGPIRRHDSLQSYNQNIYQPQK